MHERAFFPLLLGAALVLASSPALAHDSLGFHAGPGQGPDGVVIGGQAEFGTALGSAHFSPGLDLGLGDPSVAVAHGDLRWYLTRLPETSIRIYGQTGPAFVLSPDASVGLTFGVGADLPTRSGPRYHFQLRFGYGDVPDLKITLGLLFGL